MEFYAKKIKPSYVVLPAIRHIVDATNKSNLTTVRIYVLRTRQLVRSHNSHTIAIHTAHAYRNRALQFILYNFERLSSQLPLYACMRCATLFLTRDNAHKRKRQFSETAQRKPIYLTDRDHLQYLHLEFL